MAPLSGGEITETGHVFLMARTMSYRVTGALILCAVVCLLSIKLASNLSLRKRKVRASSLPRRSNVTL